MNSEPSVSVIIPAFNEELTLTATINAIRNQSFQGDYEIVVVDNCSTDRTSEIAQKLGCRVVYEGRKGYVHALKRGFSEAGGEIIACTDADTIVANDWLDRMVANLKRPGTVGCSGAFLFSDGPAWLKALGYLFGRLNWHLAGANMAVWRWAFQQIGGFTDKVNMGADVDLGLRMKKLGRIKIDRKLVVKTSARRFECAFWRTIFVYYVNDFFLFFFRTPVFYRFANYRVNQRMGLITSPFSHIAIFVGLLVFFLIPLKNASTGNSHDMVFAQKSRKVALTFDDGPSRYTSEVLDILKNKGVHATFFVLGANVEKYPGVIKRMIREGNQVGNHSYAPFLWTGFKSDQQLESELSRTSQSITRQTGEPVHLFRPPHGWRSPRMDRICREMGYQQVLWTVDPHDWQHPSSSIILQRILSHVEPGSIVLLHDGLELKDNPEQDNTVKALPALIDSLIGYGYDFVTIPQMESESRITTAPLARNE